MEEMNRENARRVTFNGDTLEECVNWLLDFKSRGESVVTSFNRHQLYSCDVTMDNAFLEVTGQTKDEYDKAKKELEEDYRKEEEEARENAEAKISDWIKRGEIFIYPERVEEWKEYVEHSAKGWTHGHDIDNVLELMEQLENGASIEEIKEIFDGQGHSGASAEMIRRIMLNFAKKGPEFFESTVDEELSPEVRKEISDKKRENAELEELHKEDSIKEVSDERNTDKKEIEELLLKKKQFMSEIENVEQQIEELRAKEITVDEKQAESNSLEDR